MRPLRTVLLTLAGLALPVGLALAVYLSSAGTIAARPASLPVASETIGHPSHPAKERANKRREDKPKSDSTTGATTDDHGGTTTEDRSGSGGDDNSGPGSSGSGSGSDNSGPGSTSSGSSGSGSGDDD
jgi:hypothetical protein